jgi:hypothetical protein
LLFARFGADRLQQLWKDQYTHACACNFPKPADCDESDQHYYYAGAAKAGFKDRTNDSSTEI